MATYLTVFEKTENSGPLKVIDSGYLIQLCSYRSRHIHLALDASLCCEWGVDRN
jgi:hypothetical protein